MFVSASVGFCALSAIIRGLRGDAHMGNFYVDMWRVVVYMFLPASLIMGVILLADGVPMTLRAGRQRGHARIGRRWATTTTARRTPSKSPAAPWPPSSPSSTWEPTAAASSAPTRRIRSRTPAPWSNILTVMNMCLFPFTLVLMFGRMLKQMRHAWVIFGVMMSMMVVMIVLGGRLGHPAAQPGP